VPQQPSSKHTCLKILHSFLYSGLTTDITTGPAMYRGDVANLSQVRATRRIFQFKTCSMLLLEKNVHLETLILMIKGPLIY
jgi:hypothetical protein